MTTNLINGKIYIGQKQLPKFKRSYYGSGIYITRALKKYGRNNFKVEIICKCDSVSMMDKKEIYYIKKYNSRNPKIGYNISYGGDSPMRGRHHNKKSRLKISKNNKGKIVSKETREKIGLSHLGMKMSKETKEKLSISHLGQKSWNKGLKMPLPSQETRNKISKANKGKKLSEKQIEFLRKINTGKKHSEETKKKMALSRKNRITKPETRLKMSLSRKGKKGKSPSQETRDKIAKTLTGKLVGNKNPFYGKHHSEETREKMRQKKSGKTTSDNQKKAASIASTKRWAEWRKIHNA